MFDDFDIFRTIKSNRYPEMVFLWAYDSAMLYTTLTLALIFLNISQDVVLAMLMGSLIASLVLLILFVTTISKRISLAIEMPKRLYSILTSRF